MAQLLVCDFLLCAGQRLRVLVLGRDVFSWWLGVNHGLKRCLQTMNIWRQETFCSNTFPFWINRLPMKNKKANCRKAVLFISYVIVHVFHLITPIQGFLSDFTTNHQFVFFSDLKHEISKWTLSSLSCVGQLKKLVYVYLVRYAEEQQDLALLSISTFQRALKVTIVQSEAFSLSEAL